MESVNKGCVTSNNLVKFYHVSPYFWFKVIYCDQIYNLFFLLNLILSYKSNIFKYVCYMLCIGDFFSSLPLLKSSVTDISSLKVLISFLIIYHSFI